MTQDDLIKDTAESFELPTSLVQAIVSVESSGNTWAVRYEPDFYTRYVRNRNFEVFRGCSQATEGVMRACSFGLMQVMGQTVRELGFREAFLTELCDPRVGLFWGCKYLQKQVVRYKGDIKMAVAAYNAGTAFISNGMFRNQSYVDKVLAAMKPL